MTTSPVACRGMHSLGPLLAEPEEEPPREDEEPQTPIELVMARAAPISPTSDSEAWNSGGPHLAPQPGPRISESYAAALRIAAAEAAPEDPEASSTASPHSECCESVDWSSICSFEGLVETPRQTSASAQDPATRKWAEAECCANGEDVLDPRTRIMTEVPTTEDQDDGEGSVAEVSMDGDDDLDGAEDVKNADLRHMKDGTDGLEAERDAPELLPCDVEEAATVLLTLQASCSEPLVAPKAAAQDIRRAAEGPHVRMQWLGGTLCCGGAVLKLFFDQRARRRGRAACNHFEEYIP